MFHGNKREIVARTDIWVKFSRNWDKWDELCPTIIFWTLPQNLFLRFF